jgi:SAM-dependent methyltransferase
VSRGPVISSSEALDAVRRSRRHPSPTQPDFLHLRALNAGLAEALGSLAPPVTRVLDVWCGSRPYDDLLPEGATCTGLDVVGNPYGVADVVSEEFLPFPDASFDALMCIEAFQFIADPAHAVAEFARVLRPGGTAVVTLVFGYEYDRTMPFEARYTEQQLRALFDAWDDVRVRQDGGRTTTWTVLTGSLLFGLEQRTGDGWPGRVARPLFHGSYAALNGLGLALSRIEPRNGAAAFPMNLTLVACTPSD